MESLIHHQKLRICSLIMHIFYNARFVFVCNICMFYSIFRSCNAVISFS